MPVTDTATSTAAATTTTPRPLDVLSATSHLIPMNMPKPGSAEATSSRLSPPQTSWTYSGDVDLNAGAVDGGVVSVDVKSEPSSGQSRALPCNEEVHDVKVDIEHTVVHDDPRKWSSGRKTMTLFIIASAAMIAGLSSNIYNPAINQIESQLHASSGQVSLSLAMFIIIQGGMPLVWSIVSEIKGRKIVYVVSIAIAVVGCIVAALAKTIDVLIGMRCLQALGTSAVMSIGAATLADIYEPAQRGTMMGIYYAAPLLGPALGPIIGGLLTQFLSWRATFWFLVIFMSCILVGFVVAFKDTFRRERSVTYQSVLRRVMREREREAREARQKASKRSSMTVVAGEREKVEEGAIDGKFGGQKPVEGQLNMQTMPDLDLEKADNFSTAPTTTDANLGGAEKPAIGEIKLSIKDVNPLPPLWFTLRRINNLAILFSSGLIFGFSYCIAYTCAITLEDQYGYDALKTGLVLLSFGCGSIAGSVLGGRWSDRVLRKLKAERGGQIPPEIRLESTKPAMLFLPLVVIAYGWLAENNIHVASLCVMLFFAGFFSIWMYSSTLSYIVDANVGRSASAVATNSTFRGAFAFLFSEVAVPLRNSIGDGGLYSLWTGLLILCELLILLVLYKGGSWRERAIAREERTAARP
ncbi:MFS general substrate transporter [Stereum hirsutum FP-91666 SS1]|uniref:MFS general substrate transporter n=1 Tax=Stereum hirsutum (strain FP-91666) TaxID=721885 RepID=UPI000444A8FB|nr:MFS general substrate transporter [Stereum hirsutum FP-91666 SS1]EIM81719.1 MFS general substrate transporter [Stereum hirsutum FP-91666 SS1]